MASGRKDGVWYDDISQAPDMGSIKCVKSSGGDNMIREYMGLSTDVAKLPKYVRTGSSFFCVDTNEIYFYEESGRAWHKAE